MVLDKKFNIQITDLAHIHFAYHILVFSDDFDPEKQRVFLDSS